MRPAFYCVAAFTAIAGLAGVSPARAIAADTVFFVVRHTDRADASVNTELSAAGKERAQQLMQTLAHLRIDAIYHTHFIRSKDTAKPLADKLHITPKEYSDPTQAWADSIIAAQKGKRTLIVGHSDTVHLIVNRLTGKSFPASSEQEFDNLFIVVISDNDKSVVRVKYGKAN